MKSIVQTYNFIYRERPELHHDKFSPCSCQCMFRVCTFISVYNNPFDSVLWTSFLMTTTTTTATPSVFVNPQIATANALELTWMHAFDCYPCDHKLEIFSLQIAQHLGGSWGSNCATRRGTFCPTTWESIVLAARNPWTDRDHYYHHPCSLPFPSLIQLQHCILHRKFSAVLTIGIAFRKASFSPSPSWLLWFQSWQFTLGQSAKTGSFYINYS